MGWIGIIFLVLLGIALLLLDLLVIPGVVISIVGILCMTGGVVAAFLQHGTVAGIITLAATALLLIVAFVLILHSKVWRRLQLNTQIDGKMNKIDSKITVGMTGKAISRLAPMGTGQFGDETVEVSSPQDFVDADTDIVITKIEGNKIIVTPKK